MRIAVEPAAARRLPGPILQGRIAALRARLARHRALVRENRRIAGRASPLERVMRRAAVHTHYAFGLQVRLHALLPSGVVRHTERVEMRPARVMGPPPPVIRQPVQVLTARQVLHRRLVERLVERWIRTGAAAAPHSPVVVHVRQRQPAPRIEMTLVRPQAPATPAAPAMAGAGITAGTARPGWPPPRFGQPAPLVLPPQELSRLTDHVIRQLDHRVLSWRERTGRV